MICRRFEKFFWRLKINVGKRNYQKFLRGGKKRREIKCKMPREHFHNAACICWAKVSKSPHPNFNALQFVKKKKCACTPFAWQKASFSSFPLPSWECNSERQPGDWVTPRVSHSAVKSHLSWLGAYSTHLLEVSHFQHYILILVSGAHQEKLRRAVWDRWDFCTRMQTLLSQSRDTDAAPKKKKKRKKKLHFILQHGTIYPSSPSQHYCPFSLFLPSAPFQYKALPIWYQCVSPLCMKGTKMQSLTIRKTFSRESRRDRDAAFAAFKNPCSEVRRL